MPSRMIRTLALFLTIQVAPSFAQSMLGRISGTVTDASGAAIGGAKVMITNTDTQATRAETTDDRGFYVAENLPIGPYRVTVDHAGFKRSEQSGNSLVADGRLTVNIALQLGDSSQTVEVTATQSEALNSVSAEIAQVVDQQQVDNLPLNGRAYMELLSLVPGAVITNPDQFSVLTSLSANSQAVNGHRTNSNNLTVDGLVNLDGGANGSLINNISPDFTQEVKIQTSNFSSQYGRSSGVAFNLVTKNGTNRFHGAAFEYFRNNALDARNTFSPSKTALRFNDFGWDVGGPIVRNKLFFFIGEEWKRLRQQAAPIRTTLPTSQQLLGNFAGTGKAINQPGNKTPYPGNIIPASQITADGKAIANVYRYGTSQAALFTDTPTTNNAVFQTPNPLNYREDLVRVDYRINDQHTLYGRWVNDFNTVYLAYGPGNANASYIPAFAENRDRPGKSVLASEIWVVTPTIVNEFHAGGSWSGQRYLNLTDRWQRSTAGFTFQRVYNSIGPYSSGIPSVNIQNFEQWKGPDQTLVSPSTNIEAADTISIVRRQHTIKAGVSVIRYRKDQNGRSNYNGSAVFNITGNPNTTGIALGDALLGNFQTYTEAAYDPIGHYRYTEPGAFVDDSWRISPKLTVNVGLRYEYLMALASTADNLANFVPSLYNLAQAVKLTSNGLIVPGSGNLYNGLQRVGSGIVQSESHLVPNFNSAAVLSVPTGVPRGLYNGEHTFAPRLGMAFTLNSKTVIRAGAGLFYDRIVGTPTQLALNNPPYVGSSQYQYGNLSNITGGVTVSAPWGTLQTIDPNLKTPYSEQMSFGIQRELPRRMFAEVDYVATLGRRLLSAPDINQPSWDTLAPASATANVNSLRPYAGYSIIQQFQSHGTSNYHALQMRLERRAGRLLFTTAYTFAKNLTDAASDTENNFNNFNLHAVYGPANSSSAAAAVDVRHAFFATVICRLPDLKERSRFLRAPLGGWQLSGISHLQSGFYYTITGSTLIGTRVADYSGGSALLPNPGPNGWINPAAFTAAPQSRFGSSGAGNVEGPGLQVYNLSAAKFFNLRPEGTVNLRLRADFQNALNHVNYQAPATTVTSIGFGTISGAYPPRNIQLGLKLTF